MEKYGFVYVWRDKKHNRLYVGCHWGTENDGYLCSSNWMRDSYKRRPEDFKRRVVQRIYTNRMELLVEEHKWLSQIKDEQIGKKFYNLSKKHCGHWASDDIKRQWMIERNTGENNPMYGRSGRVGMKHSDKTKAIIGAKSKGNMNRRGHSASSETRKKMSDAKKANPRDQTGANNYAFGTKWVTNEIQNKQIPKDTAPPPGYRFGKTNYTKEVK